VSVLLATHPAFAAHDTGEGHPERPARLRAVEEGLAEAGLTEAVTAVEPVAATDADLVRVHPAEYRDALERFVENGGGYLDGDTHVGPDSWQAARLAAGAGIETIRRLYAGDGEVGFCAVRPPGHHALASRAMGFCLLNNVAVAAAHLADRGERVAIVDYDAHHGNGTQAIFWNDPRVFYASIHQWPFYPGSGAISEVGAGPGRGTTLNIPLPAGATGDVARRAVGELVVPILSRWEPTWLIVSAGFDGHRRDPLTDMALTSGDFADMSADLVELVPRGRRLLVLEGGYDLRALSDSVGAVLSRLVDDGAHRPEHPSQGGPGTEVCDAVLKNWVSSADW